MEEFKKKGYYPAGGRSQTSSAGSIVYSNTNSGLAAGNVQDAIDTLAADYIIEEGVSGIWNYRKLANGIAECWGAKTVTTAINTAWGSLYESGDLGTVDYPADLFVTSPVLAVSVDGYQTAWPSFYGSDDSEEHTRRITLLRPTTAASSDYRISLRAIGNWK